MYTQTNEGSYLLNCGAQPPECKEGKHVWKRVCSPGASSSGWYKEKCEKCGVMIEYDTSD